jgi:hypothetical protein
MMNTVFGTPRYMAPEQCKSATLIDHRSDIYALGCILFELITGRTPFDGDLRQILHQHMHIAAPRARQYTAEISPALDDLIAQMLAKDPNARPQSMGALQATLQAHGAVSPGVAATMMPVPADMIALPFAPTLGHDARAAANRSNPPDARCGSAARARCRGHRLRRRGPSRLPFAARPKRRRGPADFGSPDHQIMR